MDPGGIVNTISKRPELYQNGSISVARLNRRHQEWRRLRPRITGKSAKTVWLSLHRLWRQRDYWRLGRHRETLSAPVDGVCRADNNHGPVNKSIAFYLSVRTRHLRLDSRHQQTLAYTGDAQARRPSTYVGDVDLMQARSAPDQTRGLKAYAAQLQHRNLSAQSVARPRVNPASTGYRDAQQ